MMTVETKVTVLEIDGNEASVGSPQLKVENVWNKSKCVRLKFNDASVVVFERELIKAIINATDNEVF